MTENAKKFLEAVSSDAALAQKLQELNQKYPTPAENLPALIAFAAEQGITLTEADLKSEAKAAVSEDELDTIAGGEYMSDSNGNLVQMCRCYGLGNGAADDLMTACYCVITGGGSRTAKGIATMGKNIGDLFAMLCTGIGE